MKPSVFIAADCFSPDSGAGVHRTVGLCRRRARDEWGVTVITARPGPEVAVDQELSEQVPAEVRMLRTPAPSLPELASRLLRRGSKERTAEGHAGLAEGSTVATD